MICLSCGQCCNPIIFSYDLSEVEAINAPPGWIERHWRLIRIGHFQEGEFYLYDCDEYDHRTHHCRIQDYKPEVCRDYPLGYSSVDESNYNSSLYPGCGYRNQWSRK